MPSRFPGFDPFIEGQFWSDFHTRFIGRLADALTPFIVPKYIAVIEERVYLEHLTEEQPDYVRPDAIVLATGRAPEPQRSSMLPVEAPVTVALPMPEQVIERFITVRRRENHEVVTVIELLSPSNKRKGSDGREQYLEKRETILRSQAHLLELDFLRGGERLPMQGDLPPGNGHVILDRKSRRPLADVWPIHLRNPLPRIPVPLSDQDPDAILDLQMIFDETYDRAGYHAMLNYGRPPKPPVCAEDLAWIEETYKS